MFPKQVLALFIVLLTVGGVAYPLSCEGGQGSGEALARLMSKGLHDPLWARIEAGRAGARKPYEATPVAGKARRHQMENPAQGLRAQFTDGGLDVAPRRDEGTWRWSMRLVGYGYADRLERLTTPEPFASGNRVEYRYDERLTEWYVNTARGIEQGFTVTEPPAGARKQGELLQLVLAVAGDLTPRMSGTDEIQFASADGTAALGYRDLHAWDARGRVLPSRMAVVSGHVRLTVDDGEAQYPVTVDPLLFSLAKLTPPDGGSRDDEFGFSVAISGGTAVVGAPSREAANGVLEGAAFVFALNGTTWTHQAELRASDAATHPEDQDLFGFSVAISGNTAVIGAPGNNPNGQKIGAGAAYVFVKEVVNGVLKWTQRAKLVASDGAAGDTFGFSVAISGDIVVVGAPGHDPGGKPRSGQVYVFARSGATWSAIAKFTGGAETDDEFGFAVALGESGGVKTVVVGAPAQDKTTPGSQTGRVSVFHSSGPNWVRQPDLVPNPNDLQSGDNFGFSVGISGETVVVGAPGHNPGGAPRAGQAYVFVRTGGAWSQQTKFSPSNKTAGDLFGTAVGIEGSIVIAGSPLRPPEAAGQAYLFIRSGTTWAEDPKELRASPPESFDFFGLAVAIGGRVAIVGAPYHGALDGPDAKAGPAYITTRLCSCTCCGQ